MKQLQMHMMNDIELLVPVTLYKSKIHPNGKNVYHLIINIKIFNDPEKPFSIN